MLLFGTNSDSLSAIYLVRVDSTGNELWSARYGRELGRTGVYAMGCAQLNDGRFILSGYPGNMVYSWLLMLDENGDSLESMLFGNGESTLVIGDIISTSDGGFICVGAYPRYGWGAKFNSDFAIEWENTYGQEAGCRLCNVLVREDCYAFCGWTSQGDGLVLRTDFEGNVIDTMEYGSNAYDAFSDIIACHDGGFALTGVTRQIDGSYDFWLVRTDSVGEQMWEYVFTNEDTDGDDFAYSVKETADGGFVVAGWGYYSYREDGHLVANDCHLVIRMDTHGELIWVQRYWYLSLNRHYRCYEVLVLPDGGYAIAGETYNPGAGDVFWLIRTEPDTFTIDAVTLVDPAFPYAVTLFSPYPNPFNGTVNLKFQLTELSNVKLTVFNMIGREIQTLWDRPATAGSHIVSCRMDGFPSGMYFAELTAGADNARCKLILVK